MAKIDLINIANLQNETSAVNTINTNSSRIEAAIENTLSRDGTAPNEMNADLDMNDNRVYNLPKAVASTEPIRKAEFDQLVLDIQAEVGPAYLTSYDNSTSGLTATNVQAAIDEIDGRVDDLEDSDVVQNAELTDLDSRVSVLEGASGTDLKTLDGTYSADKTGALNTASAWEAAATAGGTVYVTTGTYLLSSSADLDGDVTFIFDSGVSITSTHAGATFNVNSSNVKFFGDGTLITGPRAGTEYEEGNTAFYLNGTNVTPIENIVIDGFHIVDFREGGLWGEYAHSVQFSNNIVEDCTYVGAMWLSCNDTKVYNNTIQHIKPGSGGVSPKLGAYGTAFTRSSGSDSVCTGFRVWGNKIDDVPTWTGIDTHSGSRGMIYDNIITGCHIGIGLTFNSTTSPSDIRVSRNYIKGHPAAGVSINSGTVHAGQAVNVSGYASGVGARNIIVDNNEIVDSGYFDGVNYFPAISFQSTEACAATNNLLSFCRDIGISSFYVNTGLTIHGNRIQELQLNGSATALGIYLNSANHVARLGNNSLTNGSVTSMYLYRVENQSPDWMVLVSRDNYAFNATSKWYPGSNSATGVVDMGTAI
jgi:hypothetical protein